MSTKFKLGGVMKRILSFLLIFMLLATFGLAKTVKMKVRVFDKNNNPLEAVRVEIETSINVYVKYTDQSGMVEFKIKKTKNEIPDYCATKKGYRTLCGKVERNSTGDMKIKLEEK